MIDFLKMQTTIYRFADWWPTIKYYFPTLNVVMDTAEIVFPYRVKYQCFDIAIFKSEQYNYHTLEVAGSIHKNHFNGANFRPFTYDDVLSEINSICQTWHIPAPKWCILNLEVGVNVITPFAPFQYLQDNLLLHRAKTFNQYDKGINGKVLGYECTGLPIIKIYDKGLQHNLPYYLMRFELKYKKSLPFKKKGITTLADLQDINKVYTLLPLLLDAWDNTLMYQDDVDTINFTPTEKEIYKHGEHIKYWQKLLKTNKRKFNYNRKLFKTIIENSGKSVQNEVRNLIVNEWQTLFVNCTDFPRLQNNEKNQIKVLCTDFPLVKRANCTKEKTIRKKNKNSARKESKKLMLADTKKVLENVKIIDDEKTEIFVEKIQMVNDENSESEIVNEMGNKCKINKDEIRMKPKIVEVALNKNDIRYCASCHKPLHPHQNKNSIYCSEKYNGRAGKKCRNYASNPKNNLLSKIEKIENKGILFPITEMFGTEVLNILYR
jgi:hypothetical protein